MARTDFELRNDEQLIFEGKLNKMTSKLTATEGTGYITTRRLVRYEANLLLKAVIGLLALFFKQKLDFEIGLEEIRSIRRKEKGLNKNKAFYLTTVDGTEHELVAFPVETLLAAFQQAFDQHPSLTLSQLGQHEWHVQGMVKEVA